jgi:FixJ family two-component response regulator
VKEDVAHSLCVFIVADDPGACAALEEHLRGAGYRVRVFAGAAACLAAHEPGWHGCVLADLRGGTVSGADLQAQLRERGSRVPVVLVTAPSDGARLREAIDSAFALERSRLRGAAARQRGAERLAQLTPRERAVLEQVARGANARQIAALLGISPRTVEMQKKRLLIKLGLRNVSELVRLALAAEDSAK